MKVTQVGANGWQLTQLGFVNCYLVREADGFSLLDTALLSGGSKEIIESARGLGGAIRRIILTHAHGDHVGGVDSLIATLGVGSVELVSNARSVPLLRKPIDKSLAVGEAAGTIKGGLPGIDAKPTRLLVEGEQCGSLRCIHTPGHIPGHMSFLDERDGTLYAGDALTAIRGLRVSSDSPWYFPFPRFVTWNKEVTMSSAEKLLDYPIERFACGHGAVRGGGVAALKAAISLAKR